MLILGIDDAGRGPVIGPMVLAGVLIGKKEEAELKKEGVKDSKKLSQNRREFLAEIIRKKALDFYVIEKHPYEIDNNIKSGINLNKIEALMAAEIINKINEKWKNNKIVVLIDCPSTNIIKWHFYLLQFINNPNNLNFKIEHKADVNYIACAAASILAKVRREERIKEIKKKLNIDFGSGYPSDPITKKFLKEYYKDHKKDGIFRESWNTIIKEKIKKQQKKLNDF
jgi:ribonuclease HII